MDQVLAVRDILPVVAVLTPQTRHFTNRTTLVTQFYRIHPLWAAHAHVNLYCIPFEVTNVSASKAAV
jgi:hypothetical protein